MQQQQQQTWGTEIDLGAKLIELLQMTYYNHNNQEKSLQQIKVVFSCDDFFANMVYHP